MALHGDIRINGIVLYEWAAQRVSRTPKTVNTYTVEIFDFNSKAQIRNGEIEHTYDEGAVVLAAKVLAWASTTPKEG